MKSIEEHIQKDKEILADPNTSEPMRRHTLDELHELEEYVDHHHDEIEAGDHRLLCRGVRSECAARAPASGLFSDGLVSAPGAHALGRRGHFPSPSDLVQIRRRGGGGGSPGG